MKVKVKAKCTIIVGEDVYEGGTVNPNTELSMDSVEAQRLAGLGAVEILTGKAQKDEAEKVEETQPETEADDAADEESEDDAAETDLLGDEEPAAPAPAPAKNGKKK